MNNLIGGDFITFTYRHRKEIIIGTIIFIAIVSLVITGIVFYKKQDNSKEEVVVKENNSLIKKEEKKEITETEYKVDIKGQINIPGIYTMKQSSRVIDVINEAGGLTDIADTSVINLSKKITDEMVIIIYSKEQVLNFSKVKEIEKQVQDKCNQPDENSLINNACIKTENITTKISINTATKEQLMTLQGIGESKANDIIKYREENGPYETIEDLKKVPGIGDNLFAQIKEDITT